MIKISRNFWCGCLSLMLKVKLNLLISMVAIGLFRLNNTIKPALFPLMLVTSLSGCAFIPEWFGSAGPTGAQMEEKHDDLKASGIQVVNVDGKVAQRLVARHRQGLFSESFGVSKKRGYVIGAGDVIELSIWEAPPAMLFGGNCNGSGRWAVYHARDDVPRTDGE